MTIEETLIRLTNLLISNESYTTVAKIYQDALRDAIDLLEPDIRDTFVATLVHTVERRVAVMVPSRETGDFYGTTLADHGSMFGPDYADLLYREKQ